MHKKNEDEDEDDFANYRIALSCFLLQSDSDIEWKFARTKLYLDCINEGNLNGVLLLLLLLLMLWFLLSCIFLLFLLFLLLLLMSEFHHIYPIILFLPVWPGSTLPLPFDLVPPPYYLYKFMIWVNK